jgi:hypothetical protein
MRFLSHVRRKQKNGVGDKVAVSKVVDRATYQAEVDQLPPRSIIVISEAAYHGIFAFADIAM